MFEDNYINESDKILFNDKREPFLILDFKEIEEECRISSNIHYNKWVNRKFSCVKLDKEVKVGDSFTIN